MLKIDTGLCVRLVSDPKLLHLSEETLGLAW